METGHKQRVGRLPLPNYQYPRSCVYVYEVLLGNSKKKFCFSDVSCTHGHT